MTDETERRGSADGSLFLPGLVVNVRSGPDAGTTFALRSRRATIGTASDNDLVLADPAVSRHHLALEATADCVVLRDLDSTNGTRVDGVRVLSAIAEPGRRVAIGSTTLELGVAPAPLAVPISPNGSFGGLLGRSLPMRELYAVLERVAASEASVLLHGETGTGKELAAEAVHEASSRRDGPFVVVDCGAIPASLFESELFGHTKGAFTGAVRDRPGLLVEASGGTLFLDEIGELSPELQPKLLRALERRQVRAVGATQSVSIDVRVIAATHRDLAAEVNRGTFREDLYFRLAVLRVSLPPLRHRREDVPELVRLFIERIAAERIGDVDAIVEMVAHRSFPGNVRELRNAVEEALVLGAGAGRQTALRSTGLPATDPYEALHALSYEEASRAALALFQRGYVAHLVERSAGNVSLAARSASMSRRYLQTLIQRFGLD